jgi:hypothetical protein
VTRRCFGLDVHRDFAQVAIWQDGLVRQAGQIAMTAEALKVFADSLAATDEVALEATGNTNAIVRALRGKVARIVVGKPAEDPGDRRGQGQDRQGRRGDPGPTAGRRLPAGGVGR